MANSSSPGDRARASVLLEGGDRAGEGKAAVGVARSSLPSSGFKCLGSLGACLAMTGGRTEHILLPRDQSLKLPKGEVGWD